MENIILGIENDSLPLRCGKYNFNPVEEKWNQLYPSDFSTLFPVKSAKNIVLFTTSEKYGTIYSVNNLVDIIKTKLGDNLLAVHGTFTADGGEHSQDPSFDRWISPEITGVSEKELADLTSVLDILTNTIDSQENIKDNLDNIIKRLSEIKEKNKINSP